MRIYLRLLVVSLLLFAGNIVYAEAQQEKRVTGTVTSEGEPLPGVSVQLKGASSGTITDIDGNYSIEVPATGTLVFRFVGMRSVEQPVNNRSVINVTLESESKELEEVMVVAYATAKKYSFTGAASTMKAGEIEKLQTSSVSRVLEGTVSGVQASAASGQPGTDAEIRIRGIGSINASSAPLYVVDGVPFDGSVNSINPDDISSMTVLKDAASAALYGSRGANGVIIITTKQGDQNTKATVKVKASLGGSNRAVRDYDRVSTDQYFELYWEALRNQYAKSADYTPATAAAQASKDLVTKLMGGGPNPYGPQYTQPVGTDGKLVAGARPLWNSDWSDAMEQQALRTELNLSVSGGGKANQYFFSAGYLNDKGIALESGYQRFNLRLTNKLKVFDNFSIESVIAYNRQDQVAPSQLNRTLTSSYPQPGLPASTIDGKPYSWGTWLSPIWFAELGGDNKLKVSEINISEKFTYNINKHLDVVANLGYNSGVASRDIKKMAITSYNYAGTKINTKADGYKQEESSYEKTSSRTDFYSMAGYVDYHNTFAQHHNVSAMVGAQYELKEYDYFGVSVKDIQNSLETVNGAGLVNLTDKHGTKWHEAVMSYYSRLNYNYKSKYLLEVNMRYDGSSKFKPENRWDFFYGISGGWRITEEAFMKNIKWLNDLKIRLSYGEVGNQSGIDRYDGTQFYKFESQSGAYIGPNKGTIIDTNGKIASLGREWERIKNYNLGLDFSLFNSRLTGTAEVYMKRNDNMLINVSYPGVLGDNAGMSNNGKFRSHGWEVMVNWSDKIGKDFTYHIGGTYSFNTNKLTDIGAVSVLKSGFVDKQQGYPLNSIFGLRYAGKAQTEEERQKYLYRFLTGNTIGLTEQNFRLGDNMYADVNNDGKLDQNDIVYLGTDDPKISFSFNVGAEWKGFDLSLVFQGAAQRTIFRTGDNNGNEIWRIPMKALYLNTSNQSVGNTWSPENRGAYYPTYSNKNEINDYNYQASSWSVEDGSYIRLKNVTLGYNVPSAFLAKTKAISSCRIYVAGADLWEYSKINDGWDPEASRKVSAAGRFPFVRTVTFGLNLTF